MLEPRPPTAACSDLYLLHGKDQQVSWYQIAAQQLIFRRKKMQYTYTFGFVDFDQSQNSNLNTALERSSQEPLHALSAYL